MGSRTWVKIYCDKWLTGTLREETPEFRGIWVDLLALAGSGRYGDIGEIKVTNNLGYTDFQLAAILGLIEPKWILYKERLLKTDRISVNGENIIVISNWQKYQSEYQRQIPYRKLQPKVTEKVTRRTEENRRDKKRTEQNRTEDNRTDKKNETSMKDFISKYCESFKTKYGINPHISIKDKSIAKRLIQVPHIDTIMERFFNSQDKFILQNRHGLNIVESQINKLLVGEMDKYSGLREWLKKKEAEIGKQ